MIEPHLPVSPPPPNGYIVHYVPHNKQITSKFPIVGTSPVVGSPQEPSTYEGNDLNVQDFTNNENEDINEGKHST